MPKKSRRAEPKVAGFLGVGLDNQDGHRRVTETENFVLVGGSAETLERMQETAIRFGEALDQRGKRLQDVSAPEALDLLRDALR
jgi:hypothetical protein